MTSFIMVEDGKQLSDVNADDIGPDDSVSNVPKSKAASKSGSSGTSSHARIQAEAERAAILERVAALDKKHEQEAQQKQLKKRQEQLELETELAAANAKVSVLEAMRIKGGSNASLLSDGMSSYFRKGVAQKAQEEVLTEKVQELQVVRPKTRGLPVKGHDLQHTVEQSMQMHKTAELPDHQGTTKRSYSVQPQENSSVDKLQR